MSSWCFFLSLKDEKLPHGNVYNEKKDVQQSDYAVRSRIFSLRSIIQHKDVRDYLQRWLYVFGIDIKTIMKVTIIKWMLLITCCASFYWPWPRITLLEPRLFISSLSLQGFFQTRSSLGGPQPGAKQHGYAWKVVVVVHVQEVWLIPFLL